MTKKDYLKIILLDDEDGLRQLLELVIWDCFKTTVAICSYDEGDGAWKELLREQPNLFITDWNHLGMDVKTILAKLVGWQAKFPILVMSGLAQKKDIQDFIDCGLNVTLISKPYTEIELRSEILRLVPLEKAKLAAV